MDTEEGEEKSMSNSVGSIGSNSMNFEKRHRELTGNPNSSALNESALRKALATVVMCKISKKSGIFARSMQDNRYQLTTAVIKRNIYFHDKRNKGNNNTNGKCNYNNSSNSK